MRCTEHQSWLRFVFASHTFVSFRAPSLERLPLDFPSCRELDRLVRRRILQTAFGTLSKPWKRFQDQLEKNSVGHHQTTWSGAHTNAPILCDTSAKLFLEPQVDPGSFCAIQVPSIGRVCWFEGVIAADWERKTWPKNRGKNERRRKGFD